MSFAELANEHARLAMLQLLQADADYSINENVLQHALQSIGHSLSADALRTQAAWLAEQGLLVTRLVGADLQVHQVSRRGEDVALGRVTVPGVARPRPGGG